MENPWQGGVVHRTTAELWCLIATKENLVRLPGSAAINVSSQKTCMSYCGTLTDDSYLSYVSGYWSIGHRGYYQIYQILMEKVFWPEWHWSCCVMLPFFPYWAKCYEVTICLVSACWTFWFEKILHRTLSLTVILHNMLLCCWTRLDKKAFDINK